MKKLIGPLYLSLTALSFSAYATNDVIPLFPQETPLQDLPKYVFKTAYSNEYQQAKGKSAETVADVVVFYQPSYVAKYGKREAFKRITAWFALTNQTYQTHDVDFELNIKDILPVQSVDDSVPFTDVKDEEGNIIVDGSMYLFSGAVLNAGSPEYDAYQVKWKGDLVVYVREQRSGNTTAGLAGIGSELSAVVDFDTDPESYATLAHEIGHNLGMNHEEANAFVGPDYARAWTCGGKKTIMYADVALNFTNLEHYSSPDISNDGEACGNETANNARILKENHVAVSLRREGVASSGVVTFTDVTYSGSEEDGLVITLQRDGDLTEAASVKVFAEDETALLGQDYTEAFVLAEFVAGSATADVNYPILKDGENEGTETFTVHLRFPYKMTVSESNIATLSVSDNAPVGSAGMFSISGDTELNEGDEGQYIVTRSGGVGEVVITVQSISGTAESGQDFVGLNEELVFAEGETEKAVSFVTLADTIAETDESLTLEINSSSTTAEYDVKSVVVTILDDDVDVSPEVGMFALSASETTILESAGSVTISIVRSGGSDGNAVVRVRTVEGTALAGEDYTAINNEITFADGEVEKIVTIQILDDTKDEDGTTSFDVILEGAGVEVTTRTVTITLTDNDDAPETTPTPTPTPTKPDATDSSGGGSTGLFFIVLLTMFTLIRKRDLFLKK
jgi:hypothetical protein